jgi:hypothetical protein
MDQILKSQEIFTTNFFRKKKCHLYGVNYLLKGLGIILQNAG